MRTYNPKDWGVYYFPRSPERVTWYPLSYDYENKMSVAIMQFPLDAKLDEKAFVHYCNSLVDELKVVDTFKIQRADGTFIELTEQMIADITRIIITHSNNNHDTTGID